MTSVRRGWLFLSIRFGRLALPTNVVMWGATRVASFPYRSYRRFVVVIYDVSQTWMALSAYLGRWARWEGWLVPPPFVRLVDLS